MQDNYVNEDLCVERHKRIEYQLTALEVKLNDVQTDIRRIGEKIESLRMKVYLHGAFFGLLGSAAAFMVKAVLNI